MQDIQNSQSNALALVENAENSSAIATEVETINPRDRAIEARMTELRAHHLVGQRYFYPFPYLCQIYHLLNLKHLESVHGFSLNNLEILQVSHFQSSEVGGTIRFKTILRSPLNILRLWRQPVVEVDLTLHDPYTVELTIPIYRGKQVTVLFNVIPLQNRGHELFIDIYSSLKRFKPLLKIVFHLASCLTVLEDLPYIRKLARRNLERSIELDKVSNHETMQLFKRFTELYGVGV
ncbi:hypothetical protein [Altericista sp. CCNU0014]|uniref:hypothetical protein n=1 Tax=Altericista sp. CCNU0014 TaxID=3082949 RepID=UPI00384CAD02